MGESFMERYEGCLIGGAAGDALGWPAEFLSYREIVDRYGEDGITGLITEIGTKAEISDDTQMTVFTAEGLLRACTRQSEKGICDVAGIVYQSYLRWLITQGVDVNVDGMERRKLSNGWIIGIKELHHRRAPGNTCLASLSSGIMGTTDKPINNSKGCGGIMRVAPVGLIAQKEQSFVLGARLAAITHGHPSGYLAAGAFAYLIRCIIDDMKLPDAVEAMLTELRKYDGHQECSSAVRHAVILAGDGSPDAGKIAALGEGWVAEEALAISVYCALSYENDFRRAVLLSVNHGGDSDSTGAITGNIMGTYLGIEGIPEEWAYGVELSAELRELAADLRRRYRDHDVWRYKYPGE